MDGVLKWFTVIFLTPPAILRYSPLDMHREASLVYHELGHYMKSLQVDSESKAATQDKRKDSTTLLDLLVNADLTSAEAMGNIFIFLFAGHEANANTPTFLFYLFACHPAAQLRAQDEISHFQDILPYDSTYPVLMNGYVGACINEALRLYTVLPFLVKTVPEQVPPGTADGRDFVTTNGTQHRVPAGTMVLINTTALHTDPTYWPLPKPHPQQTSTPYKSATRTSAVDLFNPDLWLCGTGEKYSFLRPKAGTFVPFSDGSRGCLGKRFALVEMCAIVTQVLSKYSIELVAENDSQWQKKRDTVARTLLEDIEFNMSLRLSGKVPVRFVKRGEEKIQ